MTNTMLEPNPTNKRIKVLSIGKLLAEIIATIHQDVSINKFREQRSLLKYFEQSVHTFEPIPPSNS